MFSAATLGSVAHSLARRDLFTALDKLEDDEPKFPKYSALAQLSLAATCLAFGLGIVLLSYVTKVVTTLQMVESPPPPYSLDEITNPSLPDPAIKNADGTPVIPVRREKPITYTIRGTLGHLRATVGRSAPLRGIWFSILTSLVVMLVFTVLSIPFIPVKGILGGSIGTFLQSTLAGVLTWQFSTAWTHIVISMPSTKRSLRRLPSWRAWKSVVPAMVVAALANSIAGLAPLVLFTMWAMDPMKEEFDDDKAPRQLRIVLGRSIACLVLYLTSYFLVVIPSQVTLVRIQASLLPASDEPIVPYDHTFGGRVISEEDGGTGVVGFLDAWRSYSLSSRVRLVWTYVKFALISTAFTALFVTALFVQLIVFTPQGTLDQIGNMLSKKL